MIKLKHVIGSLLSLFIIYPDCFCDANLREIIDVNEVSKRIEDFVEDLLQANKFQVCVLHIIFPISCFIAFIFSASPGLI